MRLPDGWMSPYDWELWIDNTFDEMPSWYGDIDLREDAYLDYIKELTYSDATEGNKDKLKKCL